MSVANFRAAGEFAAYRHGALTRPQAVTLGVAPKVITRLIQSGHLDAPAPGVVTVVGSRPDWRQRLQIATDTSHQSAVVAFRSAAILHEMDGYQRPTAKELDVIELLASDQRHLRRINATLHTGPMDAADLTEVDGIRCTNIARTLADLGSVDPIGRVRKAFEWAWRNDVPLAWIQHAADRLHRPGQRGTGVLQQLLIEARHHLRPTESGLEVELEAVLSGIPGLVRQYEVRGEGGRLVARTDFAIPHARLAIEAHSKQFHFGPTAERRDELRHDNLDALGWATEYVTAALLRHPVRVRTKVLALVASRS